MQCLWVVFRKTYGWKKTEDEISLSQFAEMTGMKRPNVARAIAWLVSKKILLVIKNDTTYANRYRFNKDFETWECVIKKDTTPKGVIKKDNEVLSKKIMPVVSKKIHTKENSTKETIKRKGVTHKFVPPTLQEVTAYCQERQNKVDPQNWIDHYTSNGWRVGKNPMKDWQAAVRTWEKNDYGGNHAGKDNRSFFERDEGAVMRTAKENLLRALKNHNNKALPPCDVDTKRLFMSFGQHWLALQKRVSNGEDIFNPPEIQDRKMESAGV